MSVVLPFLSMIYKKLRAQIKVLFPILFGPTICNESQSHKSMSAFEYIFEYVRNVNLAFVTLPYFGQVVNIQIPI